MWQCLKLILDDADNFFSLKRELNNFHFLMLILDHALNTVHKDNKFFLTKYKPFIHQFYTNWTKLLSFNNMEAKSWKLYILLACVG
jgi:hypothetical protein